MENKWKQDSFRKCFKVFCGRLDYEDRIVTQYAIEPLPFQCSFYNYIGISEKKDIFSNIQG